MPGGWRLSTRLTVVAVALVIPLLVLVLASYVRDSDERRNAEIDNSLFIAQNAAAAVDAFARDIETTSVALSLGIANRAGPIDAATTGPYLQRVIAQYQTLRAIFVTDTSGRVVATDTTGVGTDLS